MLHIQLAALALTASALAASGCGSSSKGEPTTSTSASNTSTAATTSASSTQTTGETNKTEPGKLTRTELIAKAEAICARAIAQRNANDVRKQQDYARVIPQLAAYDQANVAELRKLVPPASMASDWRLIVVGYQTVATNAAKVAVYAQKNELSRGVALLEAARKAEEKIAVVAKRNGMKECERT